MSAIPLTTRDVEDDILYPTEPTPMESEAHMLAMAAVVAKLRNHFESRPDVYAIGSLFLFYEKGNPGAKRCPDVMVVKGVTKVPSRISYKLWKEQVPPAFILELTSESTADEDTGAKKELYERLGVREYFLFDPLHEFLPRQLVGFRLVAVAGNGHGNGNGDLDGVEVLYQYEELRPDAEGGVTSAELGLRLVPRGDDLELMDYSTRVVLPSPRDLKRELDEVKRNQSVLERRADEEKRRADDAARRADDAARRADAERLLRESLEQQLAELRKQVASLPPPNEGSQP